MRWGICTEKVGKKQSWKEQEKPWNLRVFTYNSDTIWENLYSKKQILCSWRIYHDNPSISTHFKYWHTAKIRVLLSVFQVLLIFSLFSWFCSKIGLIFLQFTLTEQAWKFIQSKNVYMSTFILGVKTNKKKEEISIFRFGPTFKSCLWSKT